MNPTFGTPGHDSLFWDGQQSYPDTCAIRCQEFILEQFTGREIDEKLLVQEAFEHGWYRPGWGTNPEDVGKLLELHGIAVNRYQHASIFHLAHELAQGHKVIVAVDAKELWHGNSILEEILDTMGFKSANHAVVVSGIDTSAPNNVRVILSDPGTGQAVARYPLEQFLDAWRDSNFFMVATRDPAPPLLPEMAHFDYSVGHIPEIAGISYEQFLTFAAQPEAWAQVVHHYVEVHVYHHFGGEAGLAGDVASLGNLHAGDAHQDPLTQSGPLADPCGLSDLDLDDAANDPFLADTT